MARPTKMTPDILEKLRHAFDIGATDEEACTSAEISTTTLYNYQIAHPEFLEEKTSRKEKPILRARQVVVDSLEDPKNAQWFLERKKKDEFSLRSEVTGKDGKDLKPTFVVQTEEAKESLKKLYEGSDSTNN